MKFGVVFDLDGLLVDSEPVQEKAIRATLEEFGVVLGKDAFKGMVGISTRDNFLAVLKERGAFTTIDQLIEIKSRRYLELIPCLEPMPGALDLIQALAEQGIPMAVASSSPIRDVEASLDAVGMARYLAAVVGGDQVARTKPAPDVYLAAVERLGLRPAQCVALEDAGPGVAAAAAAGLAVVAVPNQHTREHDFRASSLLLSSLRGLTPARLQTLTAGIPEDRGQE